MGLVSEQLDSLLSANAALLRENAALQSRLTEMEAREAVYIGLAKCLLDNEPDDTVADGGITVLMAWRKDAERILANPSPAAARLVDIEKAARAYLDGPNYPCGERDRLSHELYVALKPLTTTSESDAAEDCIRAYLTSLPSGHGELVERLEKYERELEHEARNIDPFSAVRLRQFGNVIGHAMLAMREAAATLRAIDEPPTGGSHG